MEITALRGSLMARKKEKRLQLLLFRARGHKAGSAENAPKKRFSGLQRRLAKRDRFT